MTSNHGHRAGRGNIIKLLTKILEELREISNQLRTLNGQEINYQPLIKSNKPAFNNDSNRPRGK